MLREPLHTTSVPLLDPFPGQRASWHVQQPIRERASRSAATSRADPEGSLSMAMASATFWRSPYSEALRQSRSSLSRSSDGPPSTSARQCLHSAARDSRSAKRDELKGILKNSSDGRESGSESSSEARQGQGQVRGGGILCKSSLSGSSHQSGEKVQKRVQFEDSTVNNPSFRPPQSARSSGAACRPDHPPVQPRAMSASPRSPRTSLPRMPSLRRDRHDLLSADKGCLLRSVSCSPRSPGHAMTSHPHPLFILRPHSGPLVRGSSVSEHALSKCPESQCCRHPVLSARNAESALLGTAAESSSSSRRDPAALEFRVYRQTPVVRVSCPRVSLAQSSAHSRARSASGYSHTRPRPFVSSALTRSYPPPVPSSSLRNNDLSLKLNPRKPGVYASPHERQTSAAHRRFLPATDMDEEEDKEENGPESFLREEKALQILQWLKEVHDKQAREGRSSVFVSSILREG